MIQRYAYGYVRVSTDKQEELSPDSQEKLLLEYAKKNNIILLEVFYEIGVSGRKAKKRPQFQRMIGLAKSENHPVDVILVWKFSRFARNQEESIVYKSLLKKQHGVDVISISEPLIEGPFGSLIERIIEWMDEYYSIRLSGEVLRGMEEKALRGGYQMCPCLGYRSVGNGKPFVIDEEQFKIVDYIFTQFDSYNTDYTAIARQLNAMGYLTRHGNPFEGRSVERILTNPFYYGLVVWNEHAFMGTHEVRCTKDQFDKRMEKIKKQYQPAKRRDISTCRHWLSGLLKCGYCNATLSYNGSSCRSPGFQCYKYSKGIHPESCFISEQKIVGLVYGYFEEILSGSDSRYDYCTDNCNGQTKRDSFIKELERLKSREARIRLAYEKEIDTLEEYKENKKRLDHEKAHIQMQLTDLNKETNTDDRPGQDNVMTQIHTVLDLIKSPDVDHAIKGSFIRSLLEDIVYDKENGQLIFHLYIS